MDKKLRQYALPVLIGLLLLAAVLNINSLSLLLQDIIGIIFPVLLGFTFAFILSVPMNGFQNIILKLCAGAKRKPAEKTVCLISFLLTLLSILLIIFLVGTIVLPQIVSSVKNVISVIREKWPEFALILKSYDIDTAPITDWLENLDWEYLVNKLASSAGLLLNMLAGTAVSTLSVIVTGAVSVVIMFYVLLSKKDLGRQSKKILYAYLKEETAERVLYIASLAYNTFAKFLSGQCVEAVILGSLIFVAFSLFRLPYAGLVAVLTAVCAFVPYIGAFLSCGVGVLLTLIANPPQALVCLVVYLVVQFVENQFIYPHVVGNSVGLSPLWTLMAVLVGGKMFGLPGMIFFIPLTAVIYTLMRENTNQKLKEKKIQVE